METRVCYHVRVCASVLFIAGGVGRMEINFWALILEQNKDTLISVALSM